MALKAIIIFLQLIIFIYFFYNKIGYEFVNVLDKNEEFAVTNLPSHVPRHFDVDLSIIKLALYLNRNLTAPAHVIGNSSVPVVLPQPMDPANIPVILLSNVEMELAVAAYNGITAVRYSDLKIPKDNAPLLASKLRWIIVNTDFQKQDLISHNQKFS